uniref:hypothetical protein n=1 Tax=Sphingomonas populi TaxID=2484750 RepID=UPI0013EED338|nr:hypothetical protein [Sphingomonas populi]
MAVIRSGNTPFAQDHQQASSRAELVDLLEGNVGQPHIVMVVHGYAVRHGEQVGAPFPEKASRPAVEHGDGGEA